MNVIAKSYENWYRSGPLAYDSTQTKVISRTIRVDN